VTFPQGGSLILEEEATLALRGFGFGSIEFLLKDPGMTEAVPSARDAYVERNGRIATVAGPNDFGRLYPEAIIFTTAAP
jgi:hypothetical protein